MNTILTYCIHCCQFVIHSGLMIRQPPDVTDRDSGNRNAGESRLSPLRIESAMGRIDSVFLHTPQFQSDLLSDLLNVNLILKLEMLNPIRCFKGRGADLFLSDLPSTSPMLVCASAGNFGQALAYCARKRNLQTVVFAAMSANRMKIERMRHLGADVRLAGSDFDAAKKFAEEFAQAIGGRYVEDGFEPPISEGAGTIAVELTADNCVLDYVLVPLGGGALLAGMAAWLRAHSPQTQIIGVCAASAPAMALSLRHGRPHPTATATTIADGIAVRAPVPAALADLHGNVDDVLLVEDKAMVEAMRLLFRHHGLVSEPAGVAGLAAAISEKQRFRGACVATPICGGNLCDQQVRQWLTN
jgi:threonine dehydratase